ncbi:hypothetical protein D3C81_2305990 [compost metagenome]
MFVLEQRRFILRLKLLNNPIIEGFRPGLRGSVTRLVPLNLAKIVNCYAASYNQNTFILQPS